jgi:hypothetical protein
MSDFEITLHGITDYQKKTTLMLWWKVEAAWGCRDGWFSTVCGKRKLGLQKNSDQQRSYVSTSCMNVIPARSRKKVVETKLVTL